MHGSARESLARDEAVLPLVVDLDRTLIRGDILVNTAIAFLATGPSAWLRLQFLLAGGKARLKAAIAEKIAVDVATLTYNTDVLDLIRRARTDGAPIIIASGSHERYVRDVAAYLKIDVWIASTADENLIGAVKRRRLVERFGERGFDYVGDSRADLAVWPAARRAVAIEPSASVARALSASHDDVTILARPEGQWRMWLPLMRRRSQSRD